MLPGFSLLGDLIGLLGLLVALIIVYYKWAHQYWQRRNVPCLTPSIPLGNMENPARKKHHLGIQIQHIYNELKQTGVKHCGVYLFSEPNYMPLDLDLLKHILTKDFQNFTDRGLYANVKVDPLSGHLFALGGPKWRNLRTKLTPTFTSGKMKMMFPNLVDCEASLLQKIEQESAKSDGIDIKEVLACFTTDVIGSCAFGLELKSFKQDNSPFRVYGRNFFTHSRMRSIKKAFCVTFPKLANLLSLRVVPKDLSDFFTQVVKDAVDQRQKNNITRNDFLQLLIDMNQQGVSESQSDGKSLTIEEMAAQCFGFFLAGFETSSTTMTFALYELARNQEMQEKVREEVFRVVAKYNGQITYEATKEMNYMDLIIDETLRMYPPVPLITRQCIQDYKLPRDIIDEDITIEKDTPVLIPIYAIHHDPEYYPEPEKFDPERFSEANKLARHPYAHIPFGEGPRVCIGMRFAMMQTKVGLGSLLQNYKFTVNRRTLEPIKMQSNSSALSTVGEMWLDAKKI